MFEPNHIDISLGKNVLQTRLKAFAEIIFIDLECFTNSLKKAILKRFIYRTFLKCIKKRFAKNAKKQSANRNEIKQKRFADKRIANRKHRYEIRSKRFAEVLESKSQTRFQNPFLLIVGTRLSPGLRSTLVQRK